MNSQLNPYISFKGNARDALEFYKSVFGGKLEMSHFKDYHVSEDPAEDDKVMHGMLTADNGIVLMAADTPNAMPYQDGARISMSLSGSNEEELRGYWEKLVEGGHINMPLEKAPWGDNFGGVTDKFGVVWMVNIFGKKAE